MPDAREKTDIGREQITPFFTSARIAMIRSIAGGEKMWETNRNPMLLFELLRLFLLRAEARALS